MGIMTRGGRQDYICAVCGEVIPAKTPQWCQNLSTRYHIECAEKAPPKRTRAAKVAIEGVPTVEGAEEIAEVA